MVAILKARYPPALVRALWDQRSPWIGVTREALGQAHGVFLLLAGFNRWARPRSRKAKRARTARP
jgi:hypothetical protein